MNNFFLKMPLILSFCLGQFVIAQEKTEEKTLHQVVRLKLPAEQTVEIQKSSALIPAQPSKAIVQIQQNRKSAVTQPASFKNITYFYPKKINHKIVTTPENLVQIPPPPKLSLSAELSFSDLQSKQENLIEVKPDEYKMIQALILIDNSKFAIAMPLLVELMSVAAYQEQATSLYVKATLELKLYTEYRETMLKYFSGAGNSVHRKMVIESLVENAKVLMPEDIAMIDPVVQILEIDTANSSLYLFKKAQFLYEKNKRKDFDQVIGLISPSASEYNQAQLLKALFDYKNNNYDQAISNLELLWNSVQENKNDQLRNITALTLARVFFQKADYMSSAKYYQLLEENSQQALESVVEKSWVQILNKNSQPAVEAMYELHDNYLSSNYLPEAYIARAAGYMNLCQYNEGVQVLEDMNKRYKNVLEILKMYQQAHADAGSYYDLAQSFKKNNKADFQGLPNEFLNRFVTDAKYEQMQNRVRFYEEENSNLNKLAIQLIRKERETKMIMLKAKSKLAAAQREKASNETLLSFEQAYTDAGVDNFIYARARASVKKIRDAAVVRLAELQKEVRDKTANQLKTNFNEMTAELQHYIQQQEDLTSKLYAKDLNSKSSTGYALTFKREVWNGNANYSRAALIDACENVQRAISTSDESVTKEEGDK